MALCGIQTYYRSGDARRTVDLPLINQNFCRRTDIVHSTPAWSSRQWTSSIRSFTTGWLEGEIKGCFSSSGNEDSWIIPPTPSKPLVGHRNGFKFASLLSFKGLPCLVNEATSPKLVFCTWVLSHSSASRSSSPVKGVESLSSSFNFELRMNLLIHATVLYNRLYLLNLAVL